MKEGMEGSKQCEVKGNYKKECQEMEDKKGRYEERMGSERRDGRTIRKGVGRRT